MVPAGPEVIEHPPTSSVDVVEDERDMYYDPPGLDIPFYVERVSQCNNRLSSSLCMYMYMYI